MPYTVSNSIKKNFSVLVPTCIKARDYYLLPQESICILKYYFKQQNKG